MLDLHGAREDEKGHTPSVSGWNMDRRAPVALQDSRTHWVWCKINVGIPREFPGTPVVRRSFPSSSAGKESSCNAGDPSSSPGSGRSTGEGIGYPLQYSWASLVVQLVKNPPATWETRVWSLSWENSLEEASQPSPVFLPVDSPLTEEPGWLQPVGLQRTRHVWMTKYNSLVINFFRLVGVSVSIRQLTGYGPEYYL